MPDQRHVAREYPLAQRYSADGAVIFRGDRQQDPYVSTSRSELKNYWAGDEKPTDAAAALPITRVLCFPRRESDHKRLRTRLLYRRAARIQ